MKHFLIRSRVRPRTRLEQSPNRHGSSPRLFKRNSPEILLHPKNHVAGERDNQCRTDEYERRNSNKTNAFVGCAAIAVTRRSSNSLRCAAAAIRTASEDAWYIPPSSNFGARRNSRRSERTFDVTFNSCTDTAATPRNKATLRKANTPAPLPQDRRQILRRCYRTSKLTVRRLAPLAHT
jgi:hypothetical protein